MFDACKVSNTVLDVEDEELFEKRPDGLLCVGSELVRNCITVSGLRYVLAYCLLKYLPGGFCGCRFNGGTYGPLYRTIFCGTMLFVLIGGSLKGGLPLFLRLVSPDPIVTNDVLFCVRGRDALLSRGGGFELLLE